LVDYDDDYDHDNDSDYVEVKEENDFHGHISDSVEWEMVMEYGAGAPLFRCATEWRGEIRGRVSVSFRFRGSSRIILLFLQGG